MSSVFLEFLFATCTAFCGLVGGWCLHSLFFLRKPSTAYETQVSQEALVWLQDMAKKMTDDVGEHNSRVQEINAGLMSVEAPKPEDVVAAVAQVFQANERMQQQLAQAEERLHEQARLIESHVAEARTDALTGIANRRAFDDEMKRCLANYQRRGRMFSVLMFDIDFFKKFNDTHGHQAGDHVLRSVAEILKQEISEPDLVARYGGEEFAVILLDSNLAISKLLAELARAAIAAASIEFEGQQLHVTVSLGLAEIVSGEDVATLIKRADKALYDSKKVGGNCGHWHDGAASHLIKREPARAVSPCENSKPGSQAKTNKPVKVSSPAPSIPAGASATDLRPDPVLGVSSRAIFCDDVNRRVAERKRGGGPVSTIFLQIDRYQEFVRAHGEGSGEVAAAAVMQFLKATMREMDHTARFEDDVFSLLLPGTELQSAKRVAERLRRAIQRCRLPLADGECQFTVSLGIAEASRHDSGEGFLELATAALKASVEAGGNITHVQNAGRQIEPVSEEALAAV